ncbi:MAG: hypothetical protein GW805_03045 [Ignavibacteria bacterium]|nr:hypothetical protein [Ignavibacteria bacterium]NCS81956.1 hypothetical protein [Ignavibacteria bacterium]
MLSTMKADNPKTVRPVNMLCAGIRIPNKAISPIPTNADVLKNYSIVQVAISEMPLIF